MLEFKYPQCSAEGQILNLGFIRESIYMIFDILSMTLCVMCVCVCLYIYIYIYIYIYRVYITFSTKGLAN